MKVKISVNDIPYSGYVNIDPEPVINEDTKHIAVKIGNPKSLNDLEDAVCDELVIHNYIEKLNVNEIYSIISSWCRKLRHRGSIKIVGTNLDTVVRAYLNGQINNRDFNAKIFGEQKTPWDSNTLMMNYTDIVDILIDIGLKIRTTELIGDKYIIVAYRV